MAPRPSTGTPPKPAASGSGSPSTSNIHSTAVVAKDEGAFQANKTPIVFYDDEVKRMHKELEAREREQALVARSSSQRRSAAPAPPPRSGVSVAGFFTRVGLFYLLLAYFLVCPTDTLRERAVCRRLDSFQHRLAAYEPTIRPYVDRAQKKLDPYLVEVQARAEPYVKKARPYVSQADRVVRPQVQRAASTYQHTIHPALIKGMERSQAATKPYVASLKKQYQLSLEPSVEWYSHALEEWYKTNAQPHLNKADKTLRTHSKQAYDFLAPVYHTGVPLAQKHYRHSFLPFAKSSYRTSRTTYVKQVHPRLLTVGGHVRAFYQTKVLPALQRFYSLFIAPQLDKISERIFEYRTKKSRAEAAEHVRTVEKDVLKEADADNFEEFISELRDTPVDVDTHLLPSDATISPPVATPSSTLSAEEQLAVNAEKRSALEKLQTVYEKEITKLGQSEHDLLLERLVEIRSNAVEDIPKRFDVLLTSLDEEGDKMVGRLGKYFARAQSEQKYSPEEQVKDADFLAKKAVAKVTKMASDVKVEAEEYKREIETKEEKALAKASQALEALVGKATEELGYGWTWLDDVTVQDWQRYHGLGKAEKNWKESYRGLQSGSIKDSALTSLQPVELLDAVEVQADSIVDTFSAILAKILKRGQAEIRGEWTGVVDEAQKASAVAGEKIAAAAAAITESASALAGTEPTPTDVLGSASSIASVASASASSLAVQAASAIPALPVADSLASIYGEASQTVLRAVGSEPSPTDLRQSASSAAKAASQAAGTAYAEASQSILRALGAEPKPTDIQQSITSLAKALESSASSALVGASSALVDIPASVTSALGVASSVVDAAVESGVSLGIDLASSVSSLAAPHVSFIAPAPVHERIAGAAGGLVESAAEFFGEASQTIVRAAGGEPSPTNAAQSATSALAAMQSAGSSALGGVGGSAASLKDEVVSSASSIAASASSVVSSASSVASSYAAPHPSFVKSQASASAGGVLSSAFSLASQASQAVHDATRTTPEGVKESATSIASVVRSKVAHLEL